MSKNRSRLNDSHFQIVLDSIRRIFRTIRLSSKSSEKTLGLSSAQIFVLQKLAETSTGISINELALATLTHQSSVSAVVSKLIDRKLVDRTISKTDSRISELRISKQGEYLLSKSPPSIQEQLIKGMTQMSKEELDGLVRGLQALIQKADMADEEPTMLFEDESDLNC